MYILNNDIIKSISFKMGKVNARKEEIYELKEKRKIAIKRAAELKDKIIDYLEEEPKIKTGFKIQEQFNLNKQNLLAYFNATEEDWNNWKWQLRKRISSVEELGLILNLSKQEMDNVKRVGDKFRWAISPYYASLIDASDENCPIRIQSIPSILEENDSLGKDDPMGEEFTSPAPGITRRYPDRLIINVTNQCAMYCRHCQRRRLFGEQDTITAREDIKAAIQYIKNNTEIRDVLITGGDALMLGEDNLDWLLSELDEISHLEIKRLGTRALVTMPQRITPELCRIIEKHPPIYINTQFNHPVEITPEVAKACDMLIKAGAVLGNQTVLLKGVNNNIHIIKKLNHELLRVRIRPYYIFHAKAVKGTSHFITSIEEGIGIMEKLRGYTSGLAIPTYIINAPKGFGKTPMLPEYLISYNIGHVIIRTWENKVLEYPNTIS